jgi:hypothetical protein
VGRINGIYIPFYYFHQNKEVNQTCQLKITLFGNISLSRISVSIQLYLFRVVKYNLNHYWTMYEHIHRHNDIISLGLHITYLEEVKWWFYCLQMTPGTSANICRPLISKYLQLAWKIKCIMELTRIIWY